MVPRQIIIIITQDVCNGFYKWSVTNMAVARIWDDIFNTSDSHSSISVVGFNTNKVMLIVTAHLQKIMVKLHLCDILEIELSRHSFFTSTID